MMIRENAVNLTTLVRGETATIVTVTACKQATKRLADLGLMPGIALKVLRKTLFNGTLEIKVRGSNLILGRGIAAKVLVTKIWQNKR